MRCLSEYIHCTRELVINAYCISKVMIKFLFTSREVFMEFTITKLDDRYISESRSDIMTTYLVSDSGKEFTITCMSNHFGCTLSLDGKEGTLYIEREDNTVHV